MTQVRRSLEQWFHRRVPIWITEYGEQTKPEYPTAASRYAQQAADAKRRCSWPPPSPYVEMFVWFTFRDSPATWHSGLVKRSGAKKPAYATFARRRRSSARPSSCARQESRSRWTCRTSTYHDAPGAVVGVTYRVYDGKKVVAVGQSTQEDRRQPVDHLTISSRP